MFYNEDDDDDADKADDENHCEEFTIKHDQVSCCSGVVYISIVMHREKEVMRQQYAYHSHVFNKTY